MKDNRRRRPGDRLRNGCGRATAPRFARLGFDVVVNYSGASRGSRDRGGARQHGGRVLVVRANVSRSEEVDAMLKQVETEFGRLDVLVNNAATTKFIRTMISTRPRRRCGMRSWG